MIQISKKKKKQPKKAAPNIVVFPHFRFLKYKEGPKSNKRKHPKLILDEQSGYYHYMGLTESPKRGHHTNIPLSENPLKNDSRPVYIRREYLARPIMDFHEQRKDYVLSKRDLSVILTEVAKLKSKKKK